MTRLSVALLLILAACSTTKPAVRIETVTVEKPVAVSCVKRDQIPNEPAATGILPPDARQAADLLAAKLIEVRNWGRRLFGIATGCAD